MSRVSASDLPLDLSGRDSELSLKERLSKLSLAIAADNDPLVVPAVVVQPLRNVRVRLEEEMHNALSVLDEAAAAVADAIHVSSAWPQQDSSNRKYANAVRFVWF
jgi:hypothetical protein